MFKLENNSKLLYETEKFEFVKIIISYLDYYEKKDEIKSEKVAKALIDMAIFFSLSPYHHFSFPFNSIRYNLLQLPVKSKAIKAELVRVINKELQLLMQVYANSVKSMSFPPETHEGKLFSEASDGFKQFLFIKDETTNHFVKIELYRRSLLRVEEVYNLDDSFIPALNSAILKYTYFTDFKKDSVEKLSSIDGIFMENHRFYCKKYPKTEEEVKNAAG